jgi:hypothetical protein
MALRRKLNLGFGGNPDAVNLSALASAGQIGGIYESGNNRYQLLQIVDGAATAKDVVYHTTYDGTQKATTLIANSSGGEVAGVCPFGVTQNYYTLVKKGGSQSTKANGVFARGYPTWADSGNNRVIPGGVFGGSLTAVTATTVGGIFQVANPCTGPWLVRSLIINRTTKSTGAGSMDAGVAVDATTGSDTLLDGLDMNATAANGENNFQNPGTNGKTSVYGAAGSYINGTASATMAGLVGTYSGTFDQVGATVSRSRSIGVAQGVISAGFVTVALDIPYV